MDLDRADLPTTVELLLPSALIIIAAARGSQFAIRIRMAMLSARHLI